MLTTAQRKRVLRAALLTPIAGARWGLPMIVWGPPGAAKTAVLNELAAELGMPCKLLSPGRSGDGAFGVTPVPMTGPDGRLRITYPSPDWVDVFVDGRGIVFCDEMTSAADDTIQAAMLGLLHEREIAGAQLPTGVRVWGAANPADVAAGGRELAFPVLNRSGHLDWPSPTVEEHEAYMLSSDTGNGGHHAATCNIADEETRVTNDWPAAWAVARGLEIAFLKRMPHLKNVTFTPGMRACATDRTWEYAARAYASSIVHNLNEEETEAFVAAFIGVGPASEWFAFIERQDLPQPDKLLDGVETWQHDPARCDRTAAVLGSCVALVTPERAARRAERAAALWSIMDATITKFDGDIGLLVPAAAALARAGLHSSKEAIKVSARLLPILRAAEVTS